MTPAVPRTVSIRRHLACCGATVEARYDPQHPEQRLLAERDLEVLVTFHPCTKDSE